MSKKLPKTKSDGLEGRVQQFGQYLLLIRKIQDKTDAEFLASLGKLSMQELQILNIIGDSEPCIMSDIAKQAALSFSSITVIVEKLVKGKLALRLRNEDDRRIVYGSLTPEGRKIYQIQIEHMHDICRKLMEALTVEEQENLLHIFKKITLSQI